MQLKSNRYPFFYPFFVAKQKEPVKNGNTNRVQLVLSMLKVVGFVYASETSIFRLAEGLHPISQTNTVRIQLPKLLVCYCTHLPSQHTNKIRTQSPCSYYLFLAGVVGFEPTKWKSQSLLPYRLATPQYYSITY